MSPRGSQGTTEGSLSGMETGTLVLPNRIQSQWELQGLYDVRGTQRTDLLAHGHSRERDLLLLGSPFRDSLEKRQWM